MKHRFLLFNIALCTALAAAFALTGCREDAIIKSSLTPAIDNINTFGIGPDFDNGRNDTITINTTTVYEDSVITSSRLNGFPIFHALGVANDPYAGKTVAGIFLQVVPTAVGFKLPATETLDYLELVLPYSGFTWGDTTSTVPHTVNVFKVTERFSKDSTFYNFSTRVVDGASIGRATFQSGPAGSGSIKDSVTALGKKRAPHLSIKLDNSFNALFTTALASTATFDSFTKALPGFYIAADSTGSGVALPYFRLNGDIGAYYSTAAIIVHTKNSTGDSTFLFPYNESQAAHFNRVTRNYAGTEAGKWLQSTALNDSIVVMQNAPGTAIDVNLPFIQSLPDDVIINKAELVFTKAIDPTGTDTRFFGPARIYPQGVNSSGGRYTIADRYPVNDVSLDFIDGTPRTVVKGATTVTQYRINIPREVQKAIVQRSNGLHLRIGGTVNFPAAYRLVLGGSGMAKTSIYRPSVNIIYSKQNK